jgi:hypothetical protein
VRSATHWSGTLSALSFVLVTMSAVAVMPGRSVSGGFVMPILISNSVFCSVVPWPDAFALVPISRTTPGSFWPGQRVDLDLGVLADRLMFTMSFSSTLTCASITDRSAITMMRSDWNCEPSTISPASFLSSLTGARHRRVDRRLRQVDARLLERGLRLRHLLLRRLVARHLDLVRGLLGVERLLRFHAAREQRLRALELALRVLARSA